MSSLSSDSSDGITVVACFDTRGYLYAGGDYKIPCNSTAVDLGLHSSCCGPNDMCLTNGLCKEKGKDHEKDNFYWSNGCTGANFNDPACPRYCMKPDERNVTSALVRFCPYTGDWCCASGPGRTDDDCCEEESRRFKAKDQEPAPSGVYRTMTFLSEDFTSTRTLSAVTLAPTPTISSTVSTITSPAPSDTPTETPLSGPEPTESNVGLKIGLGVGLSLGFVGMIAVTIMLFFNRRRRKNASAMEVFPWRTADQKYAYADLNDSGANEPSLAEMSGQGVVQEVEAIPHAPAELGGIERR